MENNYSTQSLFAEMFHHYVGDYSTFDNKVKGMLLLQLQIYIEKQMGDNYTDYETAWIFEYNFIGREIAHHYFSLKDKKWHVIKIEFKNYISWRDAKQPFRFIAELLLTVFGYKSAQIKKWNEISRKIQKDNLNA